MSDVVCRRLVGRTALITGGASGIGLASAQRLASEGANVVIADMDDRAGEAAAAEVGGIFVKVDVTSPEDNDRMYKVAVDTYGSIDIAFHNAGISPPDDDSILDTGLEAWKRVQDVNLTSVYLGCKAVLPYMLEQGRGSIINVASFVATMGAATSQISYTASKGAVLAMTREIAAIYARRGLRANALCPGPVMTPLLAKFLSDDAKRERRLVHIPMGRFGEPHEIVNGALFLASNESSWMTGQSLIIDGGITSAYVTPEGPAHS
jgi:NAD(P)-dependent dehydrogenase (short-subunit alcohol dehydrogenase family)